MREKKFRIWDKYNKKWIKEEKSETYYFTDMNGYIATVSDSFFKFLYSNDYTISQYTGLKDKKGKEIYEGDLVEITDSDDDIICQVKYEYGSFILEKDSG